MQINKGSLAFLLTAAGNGFDKKKFADSFIIQETAENDPNHDSHVEIFLKSKPVTVAALEKTPAPEEVIIPVSLGTMLKEAGVLKPSFEETVSIGDAFYPQGQNRKLIRLRSKTPGKGPLSMFEREAPSAKTNGKSAGAAHDDSYGAE